MDRAFVQACESGCVEEQPPACVATCPVHVDVRGMIEQVRKGDFAAAFAVYVRSVPFPAIISRICSHSCHAACKRSEAGDAIAIPALERAVVEYGYKRLAQPKMLGGGRKKKRIAVVGAGLSGLTLAVDLAMKGRGVAVFEAEARPLGRLRAWDPAQLPDSVIDTDLAALPGMGIDLRCGQRVGGEAGPDFSALCDVFDAVYVGTGTDPRPDGASPIDPVTLATPHPKVFAGGRARLEAGACDPILSMCDGHSAALSIERLLQGASLAANRETQGSFQTRLYTNTARHAPAPAVVPGDPERGYSRDEAVAEAERCFPCRCLECVQACEYLAHYGAYPKRYAREIFNNDSIVLGNHKSNRMANSCSLCGLCEEICPEHVGMADICLEARRSMVDKGKMPPSFHDFALRDMAFSTGDAFALARSQPGFATGAQVFFPGCQLSASSPGHVERAYALLREALPGGVGLMLDCCGAPAHWSGRRALFEENGARLRARWEEMGRPRVIAACSTCLGMLRDSLPGDSVVSLWTVLDREVPLPLPVAGPAERRFALHDPCTTRTEPEVRAAIRRLLERLGVAAVELNPPGQSPCCGFGGLMSFANPDIADKVLDRRAGESEADYLAYCAMCRDNFARRGKRSAHLLDLLFGSAGDDPAARADPGFSGRRDNRARLKLRLLRDVWGEDAMDPDPGLPLILSEAVRAQAERRLILEEDIRQVIAHAERTGAVIRDGATGHVFASHRLACVTYWVEYAASPAGFVVHRVYSHRMEIGAGQPVGHEGAPS